MAIWNEAAVRSLTDLIPEANYNEYIRGEELNIINKPPITKNADDLRDNTQWSCNLLEACNLIKTLTPSKQTFTEGKPTDTNTYDRIQELLTANNISTKNKYPSTPADVKHFLFFFEFPTQTTHQLH